MEMLAPLGSLAGLAPRVLPSIAFPPFAVRIHPTIPLHDYLSLITIRLSYFRWLAHCLRYAAYYG